MQDASSPTSYHRNFSAGIDGKYAAVLSMLDSKSSILEIGCHTGYFSRVLIERRHRVLGVESDAVAANRARAAGVPVIVGDISSPATSARIGEQFDLILLMDVLEHLVDPNKVLHEIKGLLNSKGRIVITGPNVAYWAVRAKLLFGSWSYQDTGILDRTHLHFFTSSTWRQLVDAAGYSVTRIEPAESMVPYEDFVRRIGGDAFVHWLRRVLAALRPELFTVVFLLEATPR